MIIPFVNCCYLMCGVIQLGFFLFLALNSHRIDRDPVAFLLPLLLPSTKKTSGLMAALGEIVYKCVMALKAGLFCLLLFDKWALIHCSSSSHFGEGNWATITFARALMKLVAKAKPSLPWRPSLVKAVVAKVNRAARQIGGRGTVAVLTKCTWGANE